MNRKERILFDGVDWGAAEEGGERRDGGGGGRAALCGKGGGHDLTVEDFVVMCCIILNRDFPLQGGISYERILAKVLTDVKTMVL